MIVLDASVVIAFLESTDAHHDTATQVIADTAPGALFVHPVTLAEILVGPARFGRAAEVQADLLAAGIAVAPYHDGEPLLLASLRATTARTMPDCCVLATALQLGAALATFDKALAATAEQRRVTVVTA